ncbi:MAG: hypothetical protein BRD45_04510, partial [Bacteroidetes bacterium QS_8_64_10]
MGEMRAQERPATGSRFATRRGASQHVRVDVSLQFHNTREQREVQALLSFCKRFTAWRLLVAAPARAEGKEQ